VPGSGKLSRQGQRLLGVSRHSGAGIRHFENLKSSSLDEVLENFHVSREQVQAVIDFAAKSAEPPCAA
jgi:hypothetical protein